MWSHNLQLFTYNGGELMINTLTHGDCIAWKRFPYYCIIYYSLFEGDPQFAGCGFHHKGAKNAGSTLSWFEPEKSVKQRVKLPVTR